MVSGLTLFPLSITSFSASNPNPKLCASPFRPPFVPSFSFGFSSLSVAFFSQSPDRFRLESSSHRSTGLQAELRSQFLARDAEASRLAHLVSDTLHQRAVQFVTATCVEGKPQAKHARSGQSACRPHFLHEGCPFTIHTTFFIIC